MSPSRRRFVQFGAAAATLAAMPRAAWAQAYPSRPARILVGQTPGGVNDIVSRLIGQWLAERLYRCSTRREADKRNGSADG